MSTPALHIENLSVGYGTRAVAKNLTASLRAGTLTALIGRNGTGKSTLLRTIARLQPPLEGTVSWQGRDMRGMTAHEVALTMAVVLTTNEAAPALTVTDTVETGRLPHTGLTGRLRQADRDAARQALALCGAQHLRGRLLGSLSDGERQRVMTARALAQQTPVVLLDEPTAFLDFPSKVKALQLLATLAHRMGKTVLLSTHDLELALRTADHLWLLSAQAMHEGPPQLLANSGTLARYFEEDGLRFDAETLRFSNL